jgi:hypothetical protein
MQIFGRGGAQMIPLLDQGKEGLAEFAAQADAFGLTISGKSAAAADQLDEKLKLLHDRFEGMASIVVQNTIPAVEGAVDALSDLFGEAGEGGPILGFLEDGVRDVSAFIVQMTGAVNQAVDVFEGLNVALSQIANGKSPGWQAEAWFIKAAKDGADADAKAKSILDGTYKSPDVATNKPPVGLTSALPPVATTAQTSPYQNALEHAKQQTADLVAQQNALGQTGYEAAYLTEQQTLLNDATKKGTQLSGPQISAIDAAATAFAKQKAQLEELTAVYDDGKQATEDFGSTLLDDLKAGEGLFQSLGDAASKFFGDLADDAEKAAADNIWDSIFGALKPGSSGSSGGGFNIFSAIGSLFHFAGGTNDAPGGLSLVGEQGPELMNVPRHAQISTASQTRSMLGGAGGGSLGPQQVQVLVSFDQNGNLQAYVQNVSQQQAAAGIAAYDSTLGSRIHYKATRRDPGLLKLGIRPVN